MFTKCEKVRESMLNIDNVWDNVRKYAKCLQSMKKYAKCWESMRECAKCWESVLKIDKVH